MMTFIGAKGLSRPWRAAGDAALAARLMLPDLSSSGIA
jgi:hypothetical protein